MIAAPDAPNASFLSLHYWRDWSSVRPPICIVGPNGEEWEIDRMSSNGDGWKVTGEWPSLTCAPSIVLHGYHGFLTNGEFTADVEGRDQNRALKFNLLERIDAALAEQPASAGPNRTMSDGDRERVDAFHTAYESAVEATANDLLSMAASDGLDYPAALGVAEDLIEALVAWNDAHGRTQAEVVVALRAAAEASRQPQEKGG